MTGAIRESIETVRTYCERYQITALKDFLESCQVFSEERTLNVAVLGRFKAGKSSFLNHLLGKALLPVGVIPVTSVVTEIQYGLEESAAIHFLDGRTESTTLDCIAEFISEAQNPGNRRQVGRVRVELPSMDAYRGIRFIDTPGLDSVFEHNTEASLDWIPNVGLALVAVGVDPPLSQHDIELIRKLNRYTPSISLLLTKVDLLAKDEREQVRKFVQEQLAHYWNGSVPVFPYSTQAGFEELRSKLDRDLLSQIGTESGEQRKIVLHHKVDSLLSECAGYLTLALKAAVVADSEREELRTRILGRKETIDDARLGLRLLVRHAMGATRSTFEGYLRNEEALVRRRLLTQLEKEFPSWTRSLRTAAERFDDWLRERVMEEMSEVSRRHASEFAEPLQGVGRQLAHSLQDFRNRLSERALETLGVPLRTTEMDLNAEDPRSPDVRVGKIFDRNWELLSFLVPMTLFRGTVKSHFQRKVGDVVFENLSRLVSQWEEVINNALLRLELDATRRLDDLMSTTGKLIASTGQDAPRIQQDLDHLRSLWDRLRSVQPARPK